MARIGKSVRTVNGDNQRQMLVRNGVTELFIGQAVGYVAGVTQPSVKPFATGDKFAGFVAYQHDNIMKDEKKPNVLNVPVPGSVHGCRLPLRFAELICPPATAPRPAGELA